MYLSNLLEEKKWVCIHVFVFLTFFLIHFLYFRKYKQSTSLKQQPFTADGLRSTILNDISGFQKTLKRSELHTLQLSAIHASATLKFKIPLLPSFFVSSTFGFLILPGTSPQQGKRTVWLLLQCPIAVQLHFWQQIESVTDNQNSPSPWTVLLSQPHRRVPWKSGQGQERPTLMLAHPAPGLQNEQV